jgi:hypothetical protein
MREALVSVSSPADVAVVFASANRRRPTQRALAQAAWVGGVPVAALKGALKKLAATAAAGVMATNHCGDA